MYARVCALNKILGRLLETWKFEESTQIASILSRQVWGAEETKEVVRILIVVLLQQ